MSANIAGGKTQLGGRTPEPRTSALQKSGTIARNSTLSSTPNKSPQNPRSSASPIMSSKASNPNAKGVVSHSKAQANVNVRASLQQFTSMGSSSNLPVKERAKERPSLQSFASIKASSQRNIKPAASNQRNSSQNKQEPIKGKAVSVDNHSSLQKNASGDTKKKDEGNSSFVFDTTIRNLEKPSNLKEEDSIDVDRDSLLKNLEEDQNDHSSKLETLDEEDSETPNATNTIGKFKKQKEGESKPKNSIQQVIAFSSISSRRGSPSKKCIASNFEFTQKKTALATQKASERNSIFQPMAEDDESATKPFQHFNDTIVIETVKVKNDRMSTASFSYNDVVYEEDSSVGVIKAVSKKRLTSFMVINPQTEESQDGKLSPMQSAIVAGNSIGSGITLKTCEIIEDTAHFFQKEHQDLEDFQEKRITEDFCPFEEDGIKLKAISFSNKGLLMPITDTNSITSSYDKEKDNRNAMQMTFGGSHPLSAESDSASGVKPNPSITSFSQIVDQVQSMSNPTDAVNNSMSFHIFDGEDNFRNSMNNFVKRHSFDFLNASSNFASISRMENSGFVQDAFLKGKTNLDSSLLILEKRSNSKEVINKLAMLFKRIIVFSAKLDTLRAEVSPTPDALALASFFKMYCEKEIDAMSKHGVLRMMEDLDLQISIEAAEIFSVYLNRISDQTSGSQATCPSLKFETFCKLFSSAKLNWSERKKSIFLQAGSTNPRLKSATIASTDFHYIKQVLIYTVQKIENIRNFLKNFLDVKTEDLFFDVCSEGSKEITWHSIGRLMDAFKISFVPEDLIHVFNEFSCKQRQMIDLDRFSDYFRAQFWKI